MKNNKNTIKDNNKEDLDELEDIPFLFANINAEGDISWIVSETLSDKQKKIFETINIVLYNPSIMLSMIIYIEIFLYRLVNFFHRKKK